MRFVDFRRVDDELFSSTLHSSATGAQRSSDKNPKTIIRSHKSSYRIVHNYVNGCIIFIGHSAGFVRESVHSCEVRVYKSERKRVGGRDKERESSQGFKRNFCYYFIFYFSDFFQPRTSRNWEFEENETAEGVNVLSRETGSIVRSRGAPIVVKIKTKILFFNTTFFN